MPILRDPMPRLRLLTLTFPIVLFGLASIIASGGGGGGGGVVVGGGSGGGGGGNGPALTKPIYAPDGGSIPVPNDLLFRGSVDFTLNPSLTDPNDFSDPHVAIQALDGWSTQAAFSIAFQNDDGVGLDISTLSVGQNFRMFKVMALREEVSPGIIAPTGAPQTVLAELGIAEISVDLSSFDPAGLTLVVTPLKPLEPQATYLIVVTDGILDTNGNGLVPDDQYTIAKGIDPIPAGDPDAALEPVRQLVDQSLAAAAMAGVDRDTVVLSYHFTVQSVGEVIYSAKFAYIDEFLSLGGIPATQFSSLFTDTTPFTGLGAADLYKGSLGLSYFSGLPGGGNPNAPREYFWVSAAEISDPLNPGFSIPNPTAGGFLTYADSVPQANGTELVPLLVSMPKAALGCARPGPGYPVVIFYHGFQSDRTTMLGIADNFGAPPVCTAVVAMDLPLHGIAADDPVHLGLQQASGGTVGIFEGYAAGGERERTFGLDLVDDINNMPVPGGDGNIDSSGANFINLNNMLVSRDNLRQGIMDLLALEKAIPFMDIDGDSEPDLDANRVAFVGHSLGGIIGSSYLAYSDSAESAVLANAGSGIVKLIAGSETFGPILESSLAAVGVQSDTAEFDSLLNAAQTVLDTGDGNSTAWLAMDIPALAIEVTDDNVVPNRVVGAPMSGTEPLADFLGLTRYADSGFVTDAGGLRAFTVFNRGDHLSFVTPAADINVHVEMLTQAVTFVASAGTGLLIQDESLLD